MMGKVLLLLLTVVAVSCISVATENVPYYKEVYPPVDLTGNLSNRLFFALIQSFGSEFNGSGNIAGVKVALDKINNRSDILPNHTLHYTLTDSMCIRTKALDALFNQLLSRDGISKVAVIGAGCSVATEPTAEVSHYYNVTQISCSTTSTELIDRSRFRRHFQLLQTMKGISSIYLGLINHYSWKYVSIVVQNENIFTVAMDLLKKFLYSNKVAFSEKRFESNESIAGLREPIDPAARIFIIASYERHARAFLCKAYEKNMKYPRFLIILMGWYEGKWWLRESDESCSSKEREEILEYALSVHHFTYRIPNNLTTTSGIVGGEYNHDVEVKYEGPPKYMKNLFTPYCFDATWTLAFALHSILQENPSINIQYSNEDFHQTMFDTVNASDFNGLTGPIEFNADGIRATFERHVFQFRNQSGGLELEKVGNVIMIENETEFESFFDDKILWPEGIPRDGIAKNTTVSIHPATIVVCAILGTAGIVFTIICLIFNCYFRDKILIKLGSPKLNYLIGIGAFILYVDVYLHVIPTTDHLGVKVLCNITPWFTAIGYSLCFGTIVAKMVRVYYIFNDPKPNVKKTMKDWKLAVGVLILVLVDLIILVIYTAVDGVRGFTLQRILNREYPSRSEKGFGIVEYFYILVCKSKSRDIFLGILYGYKAALQIIALVLAFSIRKVKVKGLNDALYIAAAIYITSLLWAVIIVSTYSMFEYLNAFTAVFCFGLLIGASVITSLVFIPKMIGLFKDPKGDTVFSKTGTSPSVNTSAPGNVVTGIVGDNSTEKQEGQTAEVNTLRKRVIELEEQLSEFKVVR